MHVVSDADARMSKSQSSHLLRDQAAKEIKRVRITLQPHHPTCPSETTFPVALPIPFPRSTGALIIQRFLLLHFFRNQLPKIPRDASDTRPHPARRLQRHYLPMVQPVVVIMVLQGAVETGAQKAAVKCIEGREYSGQETFGRQALERR